MWRHYFCSAGLTASGEDYGGSSGPRVVVVGASTSQVGRISKHSQQPERRVQPLAKSILSAAAANQ